MSLKNRTLPLDMPKRSSLVQCDDHADRKAVDPVQKASRCPAFTLDPSTVPLPGKTGITALIPSGKRRYGLTPPVASQWCLELITQSSLPWGKSILCSPGVRKLKLLRL